MVHKNKSETRRLYKLEMRAKQKQLKEKLKEKRAKLVVKNLPYNTNEDEVKEFFEKMGPVKEVILLKKEGGGLVGCGFIQFEAVQKAAKARHHLNGKKFKERIIEVDFAQGKKLYDIQKKKKEEVKEEIKEEPIDEDDIKQECSDDNVENDTQPKSEGDSSSAEDQSDSDSDSDSDNESESEDENDEDVEEEEEEIEPPAKKPKFISNDVNEGRTIFVKNIPFEATNEDLKKCMIQFGPVFYAMICIDKLTEHSKGSGFVKFKNKEDAEKCLNAETQIKLVDNILECLPAINKQKIEDEHIAKSQPEKRDSRHLYLIKEGLVLAGTKAAQGVSPSDMSKRLQLEQHKTQILRNLHMFISRYRLIVHNLPSNWNDGMFRTLLLKHAGPNAVLKEARIMRNMKEMDSNGLGKSKEYGFATFTTHEHALATLRSLNNNPNIFTPMNRPIVAFSIENKVMVNAKKKREEKSKQRNPLCKDFKPDEQKADDGKKTQKVSEKLEQKAAKKTKNGSAKLEVGEGKEFSGVQAKPGVSKMRNRYKLENQAKIHAGQIKHEKLRRKNLRKPNRKISQGRQVVKQKNYNDQYDNLDKFTASYQRENTVGRKKVFTNKRKGKWYEKK